MKDSLTDNERGGLDTLTKYPPRALIDFITFLDHKRSQDEKVVKETSTDDKRGGGGVRSHSTGQ